MSFFSRRPVGLSSSGRWQKPMDSELVGMLQWEEARLCSASGHSLRPRPGARQLQQRKREVRRTVIKRTTPTNLEPVACWRIPLVALESAPHKADIGCLGRFSGMLSANHLDWLRYLGDDPPDVQFPRTEIPMGVGAALSLSWLRADGALFTAAVTGYEEPTCTKTIDKSQNSVCPVAYHGKSWEVSVAEKTGNFVVFRRWNLSSCSRLIGSSFNVNKEIKSA